MLFQILRVLAALRPVRSDFQSVQVSIEPQAGPVRYTQQWPPNADPALELARLPHLDGDVDSFLSYRGEARDHSARRSGRLAPVPLGRAARPAPRPARAPRQDAAHQARRQRPLRHHRSATAQNVLRYGS